MRQVIFNTAGSTLFETYIQWSKLKEQLANLYSRSIEINPTVINALEQKALALEKLLTRNSSVFKSAQQQVTTVDIRKRLKVNEAAIEFVEFNFSDGKKVTDSIFYVALVLTKNKEAVLVPLFEKRQLDKIFTKVSGDRTDVSIKELYASRGVITKKKEKGAIINRSMYDLIWKPLEKELKAINTIYFAADGMLHRIAFAALPVNNKQLLCDKYRLVQLSSTASVVAMNRWQISDSDKVQLYGGIQYDVDTMLFKAPASTLNTGHTDTTLLQQLRGENFQYLKGTEKEIDIIRSIPGGINTVLNSRSGIHATESSFKELNGQSSPAIIHIATHGFFFPDPADENARPGEIDEKPNAFKRSKNPLLRSGLLFSGANNTWNGKPNEGQEDGILTAYEVANMYLPNTRLVVLSACETALGDIRGNEGVYGLQRAFKMSSVQNLIMSLWKVPDNETVEFMSLLYKNIFKKQSVDDAFYGAQSFMRKKYPDDPYKWAAWVLIK